jgi:hypothetical protein
MSNRIKGSTILAMFTAAVTNSSMHAASADIPRPTTRKEVVAVARRLAEIPSVEVKEESANPFNPVAYGQPDADELAAIAAARAAEEAASNKTKPANEAELLERIAERVVPSGTMTLNGEPLLIFGQRKLRTGDHLTVTYDGRDYDLELTTIQRLNYTLRLNRAEIIRRINP